ncbi:hypothetical protein [Pseudooceanicola nitratireducens]|jgi:hypothetical protein|uniref:hypothetical protein n=1 Tax=Pseudooceanicola nitratireducens TaxID=517719 RepID=UPI003C7C694E
MPVDWMEFLEKGGPFLLTSAVLAWVAWKLWQRLQEVQDARLDDHKIHTKELIENARMLDRAISAFKGGE